MKKKLFAPHYDEKFKRKVIDEYLATGCSKMSLIRKYNNVVQKKFMKPDGHNLSGNQ